jgi:hypothetical protein
MGSAVFLSYVRSTAASAARALNQSLGQDVCFLDTDDIAAGEVFPERLTDAILGAQVFVAFLDETYFQRWYCLREWLLARAPSTRSSGGAWGHRRPSTRSITWLSRSSPVSMNAWWPGCHPCCVRRTGLIGMPRARSRN